jgi:hypothetical protein
VLPGQVPERAIEPPEWWQDSEKEDAVETWETLETAFTGNPDRKLICPICGGDMTYKGLIAMDNGRNSQEMWRFDCEHGHTMLLDYTSEMGDEDEDEDEED